MNTSHIAVVHDRSKLPVRSDVSEEPSAALSPDPVFAENHILCATDFSQSSQDAANIAALLATKQNIALKLQHFAPELVASAEFPAFEKSDDSSRHELEAERTRLSPLCTRVAAVLSHGNPGPEIAASSKEHTSLIVVGSTGKGRTQRCLLGSTAERIAENAPVPTLVVRQAERLQEWLTSGRLLRVLCAVDFSVSADAGISALKQFRTVGGEVQLVVGCIVRNEDDSSPNDHFCPTPSGEPCSGTGPDLERDLWERIHDVLGDVPAEVHVRFTEGSRAREFLRLAEERGSDLIVVGTHQTHGLRRLMSPSFSREVLARAPVNVLCVPLVSYHPAFTIPQLRRVLVATDFSENGNAALQHAFSLLPTGGDIKIIHVCAAPAPSSPPELGASPYLDVTTEVTHNRRDSEQKLKDLIPKHLVTAGVRTTSEVLFDLSPSKAICQAAERFGADIICVGTRGRQISKALLGSVSSSVIAHSHVPVLTVPTPKL